MNIEPIVTRLQATIPALRDVGGAAEFEAVTATGTPAKPAAYVIPLTDSADDPYLGIGATAQRITATFGVLLIAANHVRGRLGTKALEDLNTLRVAVRQALIGWQPGAAFEPCLFSDGALIDFEPGLIYWQDNYRTAYDARTTQ